MEVITVLESMREFNIDTSDLMEQCFDCDGIGCSDGSMHKVASRMAGIGLATQKGGVWSIFRSRNVEK
jgi:hypothetical protein